MRSGAIPFRFDIREPLKKLQRLATSHVGEVTLSLPFFSVAVNPTGLEKKVARELVIRLKDRRVLSAWECCDHCIKEALASLQEIRRLLVDKQVELSGVQDGPLYILTEAMADGIRQFLSFEQRLNHSAERVRARPNRDELPYKIPQQYFDALEILRAHLSSCATQVAEIAGIEVPDTGLIGNYKSSWVVAAYETLELGVDKPAPSEGEPS
jgi:hypothetical protein